MDRNLRYFKNARLTEKGLGGRIGYGTAGAMGGANTPTSSDGSDSV